MPKTYQTYLISLLLELKKKLNVKVLTYDTAIQADYKVNPKNFKNILYRLFYKLGVSKHQSLDSKIMSNYDIIHLQHSYLFSKILPFFKDTIGSPKSVITLRGSDTYIKPWIFPWWLDFYKNKSQYIDAFITVSEHQKKYLKRWGIPESKIYVIPVSFGLQTNAKPKYPSSKAIKIVSAHRMCWEKNIEGNLRVIKLLIEKGYEVQYDIFGDGPDKGQLFYLVDKYKLNKHVKIHGKIDNKSFIKKLSNYDFFLQLSHSEALGVSVIEAQSMGIPAIISNSGGLPETIIDQKSGFCVDSTDSEEASKHIINLFNNRDNFFSFSNEAIKYSNDNFSTTNEVEKLIGLYKILNKE